MSGHSCSDEHSHSNGHDHGGGGHDHDHDHDHPTSAGPADNLYEKIDHPHVVALNASQPANVCKPWNERMDESVVRFLLFAFLHFFNLFIKSSFHLHIFIH